MSKPHRRACSTRTRRARAVLLEKHGLVTWGETRRGELRGDDRVRLARRRSARHAPRAAGSASGGRESRSSGRRSATPSSRSSLPALRGALLADARRRRARGRPQPRGGRVRLVGARARGEPDRRAVPRPPDQHEAQAARRRVRSREPDGAAELAAALPRGVDEYAEWYRDYYERNLDDETRQFPIDPAGPRVVLVPGVGIVTTRPRRGQGARRARPLPPRDRRRGRGRRARRLPLAERERGVRDRVLAARAVQARAGAAAGRARRPDRADHRRCERDRSRDRARCSPHAARTSSSPTSTSTAPRRSRTRSSPRTAYAAPLAVQVDVTSEDAVVEMTRRTVLEYGGLDILVASAGLATSAPITETTLDDWERNFAVLARGYFLAAREAFRVLVEQGRGGSIVFVALEERARRGRERRGVLVGEGGVAPPRALPRRGGRAARDPRQHRQPRRGDPGLEHLVVRLEGRAREHLRRRRGRPADLLPGPHEARRRRLPEDVAEAIAFFAGPALGQVDRKRRQRRRRRDRRVSPVSAKEAHRAPGRSSQPHAKGINRCTSADGRSSLAAVLVAGVAVTAALAAPSRAGGGQDVLLHPEGHPQPVRGDRRPRRQARAHRARRHAGRLVGHARTPRRRSSRRSRPRSRRTPPASSSPATTRRPSARRSSRRRRRGRRSSRSTRT